MQIFFEEDRALTLPHLHSFLPSPLTLALSRGVERG